MLRGYVTVWLPVGVLSFTYMLAYPMFVRALSKVTMIIYNKSTIDKKYQARTKFLTDVQRFA